MQFDTKTQEIIKSAGANRIRADSATRPFGSRVDDEERRADIDLWIENPRAIKNRIQAEYPLAARLYVKRGGRKVDVLIHDEDTPDRPVYQRATQSGIVL